jgi:hypothetical protein
VERRVGFVRALCGGRGDHSFVGSSVVKAHQGDWELGVSLSGQAFVAS